MKATGPDPMADAIAAEVARLQEKDAPFLRAAAEVLPGPLADAFALAQDIPVGKYKVRAFVDRDFEFLRLLNHPLDTMYKDQLSGKVSETQFVPSGLPMWQAAFMMTRPVIEVKALLKETGGVAKLNQLAEDEFADLPGRALTMLFEAVFRQILISSSTAVSYGVAEESDRGEEEAKAKENPPLDLRQATG